MNSEISTMDKTLLTIAISVVAGFLLIVAFFVVKTFKMFTQGDKPLTKFLNKERQRAALQEIIELSHDTKLFRFALPSGSCLGLPCGKHIRIYAPNPNVGAKCTWNGNTDGETDAEIERKYTPTSSDLDEGRFDLVVKVYKPNDKFADGGKASQYLDTLQVSDMLEFSGPWGLIEYKGKGLFKKGSKDISCSRIGMIAGGTGITPMLQVIEAILTDPTDQTAVSLIFANQTESDILLRRRLEELAVDHKDRFKVHFTLDRPPENWTHSKGFVTKEMIQENFWPAGDDVVVLLCGPPPMIKFACKPNLEALGYASDRVLEF